MAVFRLDISCSAVILVLVLLQCTSTVFTQSTPTPPLDPCQNYTVDRNCKFYNECVESRVACGQEEYALGYGHKYCNRFVQHKEKFNKEGQQWIHDAQRCLMEKIERSDLYTSPPSTATSQDCINLRNLAFDSHPKCYIDHGFCSIAFSNLNGLFHALEYGRDFVGPFWKEAWTQVGKTITRCCRTDSNFKIKLGLALGVGSLLVTRNLRVTFRFLELYNLYCDPCQLALVVDLSVVFLFDSSGSIGSTSFTNMKFSAASAAVALAEAGARVGVVVFSDSASVDVPLQMWEDPDQLRRSIEGINYVGGGTNTHIGLSTAASVLGNEGTRVILLLTDGQSNDRPAAENAAYAAKQAEIRIYAGGIGDSVNEDELNSLASYPPEEYRVSIADFTETALNEELQLLIASTCLTPEQASTGQQQIVILRVGQVFSLQYDLPEHGLTITANVIGEANMYISYTIRNPTFVTADFITGGSGFLSFFVPFVGGLLKRQANEDSSNTKVFVSIVAKKDNTTVTVNTTDGNTFTQKVPGAPVDFTVTMFNYTSGELHFVWYQPLLTNGIITEYMLQCIPEVPGLPNCEKRINSALYLAGQHFTAVLSCLKRGVTYNCSLQASNDAGYGPASHMIFAEEKPLSFGISEVIPGTVEFTWQPLNESSVNYTVSCHSSRSSVRVMTSDLGIKVNTLTSATIYDCSLMSHTSDGEVPIDYYSFLTVPGKSRKVKVTQRGPHTVHLTWLTPLGGDNIISHYNFYIHCHDEIWTSDGPAKEFTMSSPVLEQVVLIRVQAVNDAGEGPWSGVNLWYY